MNEKIISENMQMKLLGVTIDGNLNFNSHIKEICRKIDHKTSALFRLPEHIKEKNHFITEYGRGSKFSMLSISMVVRKRNSR